MNLTVGLRYISVHWKFILTILVPLIFLPLPLQGTRELRCAYVVCIMAIYWVTDVIPLPVTALLPVVLFPLLNVESTGKICMAYLKGTTMTFIGGFVIAIAAEHSRLHMRIALKILLLVGTSPKRLLLGFMVTTMFFSMWICNTAATALILPILLAVLEALKTNGGDGRKELPKITDKEDLTKCCVDTGVSDNEMNNVSHDEESGNGRPTKEEICYFLGVAYAANIGGTGTITGSGTNLVFKGLYESLFPDAPPINFANWMAFAIPLMIINLILAWIWLQIFHYGLFNCRGKAKSRPNQQKVVREVIQQRYDELGPITYHEINIVVLFITLIALWFFRKPEFILGWGQLYKDIVVEDATAAMLIVFLLFVLPANTDFLSSEAKECPSLVTWKLVHERVPWGLVLLMGGGFAMAAASEVSGLSKLLGEQLMGLKGLSPIIILTITCICTSFVTEVASNPAIANIVLPVLAELCTGIGLNPLYLMLPATFCCSYAYMLPVATPGNAVVMNASNMRTSDMIKSGLVMNFISVFTLIICFLTFGMEIYDKNSSTSLSF